jgi:hypothetical protein
MRAVLICALAACGGAAPAPATPTPSPATPPPGVEAELVHGHPSQQRFDEIVASFPSLSAERRAAIAATGTSEDAPIRVPDIRAEYVWVAKIACNGGAGQVQQQSLVRAAAGDLDELQFTCPGDTAQHAVYFDFSADPAEQQMKKELGLGP